MQRTRPFRAEYAEFQVMTTRWQDNDVYGHMNNAVYHEFVDACVNGWIMRTGTLDIPHGDVIGLVVETGCVFHESLGFPDPVDCGLRVERIGNSSVRYEVGLFRHKAEQAAAEARLIHVYVDSETRKPVPIPTAFRAALDGITRP